MSYKGRLALLVLLDSIIVSIAIFIAFWILYPYSTTPYDYMIIGITAFALILFHHLYAFIYSLYNKMWAYSSVGELVAIVKAVILTITLVVIVQFILDNFLTF